MEFKYNYSYWRDLLLSKGFEEPYFSTNGTAKVPDFPMSKVEACWGHYVFKKGPFEFLLRMRGDNKFPHINFVYPILIDNRYSFVGDLNDIKEANNIELVINAIADYEEAPLCIGIDWAAPLIEIIFKKYLKKSDYVEVS